MEQDTSNPIKMFFYRVDQKHFNILLVILLAAFLVLPKNCLAEESINNITREEIEKNLELSGGDSQELMNTLRQAFTIELIDLWSSSYATDQEIAVASILLKASKIEEVNYFLKDAPIDATKGIIKGAIEIAQLVLSKNLSDVLDKIEQKTVKMAVDYGINTLIGNEIRVGTGAMKFKYFSYKNEQKEVLFQYIIVFHPLSSGMGNVEMRFYSPSPIAAPSASKLRNGSSFYIPDLQKEIPPFIVDLSGTVKKDFFDNYQWVDENNKSSQPLIKIDFPEKVPDFGIKPSTLLETQILNPIESTIKEIKVITSKTIGSPPSTNDIWNRIKLIISEANVFSPAAIIGEKDSSPDQTESGKLSDIINKGIKQFLLDYSNKKLDNQKNTSQVSDFKEDSSLQLTLEEIQEIVDDISEKIDILNQEADEISKTDEDPPEPQETPINKEEDEEKEDTEDIDDLKQKESLVLCERKGGFAENQVIFNEIAWMGSNNSSNDEWIELKNISGNPIDLAGWQIISRDKKIQIIFTREIIPLSGFLLLERTDDDSVPGARADLIYSGNINNTNESLYLFNKDCQLQDEVMANPNWEAGDNSTKRTMERKINLTWQTSAASEGTPRKENSYGYFQAGASGGAGVNPSVPVTPQIILNVLISEIQITSATNTNDEFIELYNPNDQEADISQWSIQKSHSTSTNIYKKNFEKESKIPAKSYFLIVNSSSTDQALLSLADFTHKSFNLAKDNTIYLVKNQEEIENASDGDIIDMVGFGQNVFSEKYPAENPSEGKSVGRKWSTTSQSYLDQSNNQSDFEIQDPTPKSENKTQEVPPGPEPKPAVPPLAVVINEIAWMGTSASSTSDEWIELYNNSSTSLDLTGWKIKKNGEEFINISASSIPALGFYLLERATPDTTEIAEDNIYVGSLNNGGDKLELISSEGILIDTVDCTNGWFAGVASPLYISMERIDSSVSGSLSDNWENNNLLVRNGKSKDEKNISGTPKSKNSVSKSPTLIIGVPFNEFSEITLTYHGSPYIINNRLPVAKGKLLKIEKGVIIKFPQNSGLEVQGRVEAIGGDGDNEKIVFTSLKDDDYGGDTNGDGPSTPNPGDWDWLYFKDSFGSVFKNAIFKYGSAIHGCFPCCECLTKGMINVEEGEITIEDSVIEKSQTIGLWLIYSSTTVNNVRFLNMQGTESFSVSAGVQIEGGNPTIKNSYFSGNKAALRILTKATPIIENNIFENNNAPIYFNQSYPVFKNNQANNNDFNGIYVGASNLSTTTWYADLPYIVDYLTIGENAVDFGSTLNLEPGVIVKIKNSYANKGKMDVYGRISAQGTVTSPVVFTSFNDDSYGGDTNSDSNNSSPNKGDWLKINFHSSGSVLDNTIIKYGGAEAENSVVISGAVAVEEEDTEITIRNSEISDNICGIYFSGPCYKINNIHLENNIFFNNNHNIYCP